jgi:hypothetical protein
MENTKYQSSPAASRIISRISVGMVEISLERRGMVASFLEGKIIVYVYVYVCK